MYKNNTENDSQKIKLLSSNIRSDTLEEPITNKVPITNEVPITLNDDIYSDIKASKNCVLDISDSKTIFLHNLENRTVSFSLPKQNNIIIGADGYLGSYLSFRIKNSYKIYHYTFNDFINKYNNNLFNNSTIFICADQQNNYKIISDLQLNSHMDNTFILFSSASIYNSDKLMYNEDDFKYDGKENNYQRMLIKNEKSVNTLKGRKVIIRLGTLFGFAPKLNATRGINRMIYSSILNNQMKVSNPDAKKSYTALSDLYKFINLVQENEVISGVFNISSFNTDIGEITKNISEKYDILMLTENINHTVYSFHLDTKLANENGWYPEVNIDNMYDELTNDIESIELIKYDEEVEVVTNANSYLGNIFKKNSETIIKKNKVVIYKSLDYCRVCKCKELLPILNLNSHPPPNRLNDKMWKFINFKLILNCCLKCWHCQLNGVVNPLIMYSNYPYLSGTSQTMNDYFSYFVNIILNGTFTKKFLKKYKVLDIGCNDGALLDKFKKKGFYTYGVDPANNLQNENHKYYHGFFNSDAVEYFNTTFDIITAFNVFGHVDSIYDFMKNLELISHNDTQIFIQTSQCNMIINNEFDTIYHEHLSFFNLNSMLKVCENSNFYLKDCKIVDVHGKSYLFCLKKKSLNGNDTINSSVIAQFQKEVKYKYYNIDTYFDYSKNILVWKNNLIDILLSNNNNRIIGVGASAKGITILNFLNEDFKNYNIKIEYLIDENPLKIGKTIDSIDMKIESFDYIREMDNVLYILFAWNFKTELIDKILNLDRFSSNKNNVSFLNLFPLEIEN